METVGAANICRVGREFAVVPHELGAIDFRIRSHRGAPGITWTSGLSEARESAQKMRPAPSPTGPICPAQALPANGYPDPVGLEFILTPQQRFTALERRLTSVESGLEGIHQSLTWRALTSVGGLLLKAGGMLRPRRNGGRLPAVPRDGMNA